MARRGRFVPARICPERRFRRRHRRHRIHRRQQIHCRRTCRSYELLLPRKEPVGQNGRLVVGILRRRNGPDAHRTEDTERQSHLGNGLHHYAVVRNLHRDDDLGRQRNRAGSHHRGTRHTDRRRRTASLPRFGRGGRGAANRIQRRRAHRHGILAGTLRREEDTRFVHAPHRSGTCSGALRLGTSRLHDRPRQRLGGNSLGTLLRRTRNALRNRPHAQRFRNARTAGSRHSGRHHRRLDDRDEPRTRRGIHRYIESQGRAGGRLVRIHDPRSTVIRRDRSTSGR